MIGRRKGHGRGSVGRARRPSPEGPSNGDDGFTLVELVIVLTIIPIVIAGISAAIITSFKDQVGIYNRLSDSHDAQITSAYFVPDVESASYITTSFSGVPCEPSLAATGYLLDLTELIGGQTDQVYYLYNALGYTSNSQQNALLRIVCGGNGFTAQVGTNTIVAHDVSLISKPTATVTCFTPTPVTPVPLPPSWSPWGCTNGIGGSAPGISNVSLTVTEVPTNSANVPLDSFNYSLSATPRAWVPDTAAVSGGAPVPALLVLGSNMRHGANLISFTGPGQTLTTTQSTPAGDIDVDSQDAGSVSMGVGNDTIKTSGIQPGVLAVYKCAASQGTPCTNNAVSSGVPSNQYPIPVSMGSTPFQDPLGNLPTPPVPSLSAAPPCTGPTGALGPTISVNHQTITCTAGLYGSGLTITGSNDVITFQGGAGAEYQFGNPGCNTPAKCALTGLTVSGGSDTLNFQSATYIFEGSVSDMNVCSSTGLSAPNKGGISLSGPGGDLLQDNGAGVLLDIVGGPADFGCGVTTDNTVDLSPLATGLYQGVLLFDNRTPANPQIVVLDGLSTTGTIYAPDSYAYVWGNAANTTGSLIVQTLSLLEGNLTIQ